MQLGHKAKGKVEREIGHFEGSLGRLGRFRPSLYRTKAHIVHTKNKVGKLGNLFNPNHRHDEAHELMTDHKRTEIAQSHRFSSFAPVREGNKIKWYVDARDYFWAVSEALENAKESIYLADWWISPELFLRRPPYGNQYWRLDQILKRRAEAGVKIYVIIYKEMSQAITCNSAHTKDVLNHLCPRGTLGFGNIHVLRHPDHFVFENAADMTFYWAHHEKFIVIDHSLAFIGGLDLCWGRWDTNQHSLADVYRNPLLEMFPGQDYNNNRIMDFQSVQQWETNALNKSEYPRMPWHDVAMGLIGDCVYDIAEHFVLRWNMVKRDKYKRDQNVDWLILEGRTDRDYDLISVQHPKYPCGDYVLHPFSPLKWRPRGLQGTVRAQVVRSSGDWSSGILVEHSIQNAYAEIIRNAEHFVYIENQFFITTTEHGQTPIYNTVGQAIVDACVRAGKEGRKFRVIIVIPAIPGFPGDLRRSGATGTRAIMDYQFKSINRGQHSVMGRIASQGVDPNQHIFVFNMRSYDRINYPPKQLERDQRAGMDSISIQLELADALMGEGAFPDDNNKGHHHHGKRKSRRAMEKYQRKFEYIRESTSRLEEDKADRRIRGKDSVAEIAMANGGKMSDEQWEGDPEREKEHFVQEQLYTHGKLCIVDDRVVICGSANINDRSQLGDRDSELAIVMEDQDLIDSTMDGKPYKAARQAATLRQHLWKEHLGLLPGQKPEAQDDPNAQPPDVCMNQVIEGPENELVEDPLGDKPWKTWTETATLNTEIYRYLFHADPDDCIQTFEDYDRFRPPGRYKEGHLFDFKLPAAEVRRKLDQIRGHVVWMPLEFLRDTEMAEPGLTVNRITESIYT